MEINLLREAALPVNSRCHRTAQRTRVLRKNPVALAFLNATNPGMLLAATALTPLPRLSQDCISAFIVQIGATINRSGRTTGKTFAGRSGLVSGGVCNREDADGDNIA